MEPGVVALTAIVYYHLGMLTVQTLGLVETILLGVLIDAILLYLFFSRHVSLRRNRPAAG